MFFLSRLLKIVLLLFVVRLVLRGFAALVRAKRPPAAPARRPGPPASVDLIRDRVCNTFLPRDRALRALVAGHEEHFCSTACRDKALAALSQAS